MSRLMPPSPVVVGFGRCGWLLTLPTFLLWPLAVTPLTHRLFVPRSRAMHILRALVAAGASPSTYGGRSAGGSSFALFDGQEME